MALGQKESEMGGSKSQGWGTNGDTNLSKGPVAGTETHKQQPGKVGLPANLTPESRDRSPHWLGLAELGGVPQVRVQPEVVRCPPKPTTALPAGRGVRGGVQKHISD